jgi:hypothetical protein
VADPQDAPREPVPAATEVEDPLAADRRTLVVGASAMVGLILVGVVSAQLFARGGCTSVVEPRPAEAVTAGMSPEDVVDERLAPVDGARAVDILEQATGALVDAAIPVGDAVAVTELGDGLVTTGGTVVSLDDTLAPIATFTTDGQVVGDGPTVFEVTVANAATGQTDAFVPLRGTGLEVGGCVDTAVVGSPFAFLLGGGDGELLLLRADEDGDRPSLQLRGADAATRWDTRVPQPAGPPGTLAERLSARMGPDTVVAARRVGPQEEVDVPAVVVLDRADGSIEVELDHEVLADAAGLDPDAPLRYEVAAVGASTALLHARPDPADGEVVATADEGALLLLDLDGTVTAVIEDVGPFRSAAVDGDRYVVATVGADGGDDEVTSIDAEGAVTELGATVTEPRFAWLGDAVLVASRDSFGTFTLDGPAPNGAILVGGRFADVTVTDDGRVAALVTRREGGEAVLLVTAPVAATSLPSS